MKTCNRFVKHLLVLLLVLPINLLAQVNEMPISTNSEEAKKLFEEGRIDLENFESDKALELFNQAIEKDAEFALAYLYRGYVVSGKNAKLDREKAFSLYDKVSDGEKLLLDFYQAYANRDAKKREEILSKLLEAFPTDKRAHNLAGVYYYNTIQDYPKALYHFESAVELDKSFAAAINMVGYSHVALTNYVEAEKAFKTYISLIPDKASGYDSYAELFLTQGKYNESIEQYKKSLEIDPHYWSALIGLGNNYTFLEDYDQARKYYRELSTNSTQASKKIYALFMEATSFVHEGKNDEAIKILEERKQLAEKEEMPLQAIYSIAYQGFILLENGKHAEGLEYYIKVNELIEKSDINKKQMEHYCLLGNIWVAYAYSVNQSFDKANEFIAKCKTDVVSRNNPAELNIFNSVMGYMELQQGNVEKSISYYALTDKDNTWNSYCMALAYKQKGEMEQANKLLKSIVDNNSNDMALALVRKRAQKELQK